MTPCPMRSGLPCAEVPPCDRTEPIAQVQSAKYGPVSCAAPLGRTSCAEWVRAVRLHGAKALESQVDPRAADALPE